MIELSAHGISLPDAYHNALRALFWHGLNVPCPDYGTNQREVSMTMTVKKPLAEPMISRLFIGGPRELEQYRQEILDGILDFEIDRGNWAYTYHDRIASQLPFIYEELRRNPYSRRAVISVRADADVGSSDPACLQHIQYFVRDNALHCKVLFRSNDAVKATFMNAFALIMLQKRVADELGYEMGTYIHRANSFHVYERDFEMLHGYAKRIINSVDKSDITYNYKGEWKDIMDAYKPEIAAMVKELKSRG